LNTSIEKDDDPVASTSVVSKVVQENKQPTPILVLKYLDNYLSFGFTFNGPENRPVPQLSCVEKNSATNSWSLVNGKGI